MSPKKRPAGPTAKGKAPAPKAAPVVQLDSDESSNDEVVVSPKRKGKAKASAQAEGKKRARSPSTSSVSHASPSAASGSDSDSLPVPASIAASNKRIRSQREERLNQSALRDSGKKGKDGKRRKVDTKRKLAALSQGARDRRSADEDSDGFDFVVDDEVVEYDTPTDEDEEQRETRKARNARVRAKSKGKGKERAVEADSDDGEDGSDESDRSRKKKRAKGKAASGKKEKSRKAFQRELMATDSENDDITGVSAKSRARQKAKARKEAEARKKERRKRRRQKRSDSGSDSSDEEEDEEMDDLEILDEQTVFEDRFRSRKSGAAKFASLKAARDRAYSSYPMSIQIGTYRALRRRETSQEQGDRARLRRRGSAADRPQVRSREAQLSPLPRRPRTLQHFSIELRLF